MPKHPDSPKGVLPHLLYIFQNNANQETLTFIRSYFLFGFGMNKNLTTSNFLNKQKFNNIITKTLYEQIIITKALYKQLIKSDR